MDKYSIEEFTKLYNAQIEPEAQESSFAGSMSSQQPQANFSIEAEQPVEKEKTGGLLGKVSRFTGVDALGRGLGKALFQFTPEYKNALKMVERGEMLQEEFDNISTGGLTNKEVVGSGLQTAANFIPGAKFAPLAKGAKTADKVIKGTKVLGASAATGYAYDVAGGLQDNESVGDVLTPGLGTALGATMPVLGKITGLSSKQLEQMNTRMTPVEKQNLAKKGKDIAGYLSKKKVIGTPEARFAKVDKIYDQMENTVTGEIKKANLNFSKKEIIDAITEIPNKFKDDVADFGSIQGEIDTVINNLQKNQGDKISGETVNNIKRLVMKKAYAKDASTVKNEALHSVGELLMEKLNSKVKGLKSLNEEYGLIIASRKVLFKATTRNQLGLIGRTMGAAAGAGIGGSVSGGTGALVGGVAGERVASTLATPLRSFAGAGLQTAANNPDLLNKGINSVVNQNTEGNPDVGMELERAINNLPPAKKRLLINLLEEGIGGN